MLKRIFHKTISSVWFKPAVISIISFILALLTGEFDTGGYEEIKGFLPHLTVLLLEVYPVSPPGKSLPDIPVLPHMILFRRS